MDLGSVYVSDVDLNLLEFEVLGHFNLCPFLCFLIYESI